jgi:hypothetical protein
MEPLLVLAMAAVLAVFGFAAFAQIKAIYHFMRYWGGMTPKQRWSLSLLGPFALAWNRGLPDELLRHRSLFFKWEGIFSLVFALIATVDFAFKYQTGEPLFSRSADAKR